MSENEELKYLRIIKEDPDNYGGEKVPGGTNLEGLVLGEDYVDIDIAEIDVSPPTNSMDYESSLDRTASTAAAAYYVLENKFSAGVNITILWFLLEAVYGGTKKTESDNIIFRTSGNKLPSYTFYVGYGDHERVITGVTFDTLSYEIEKEFLTVSCDIKGKVDKKETVLKDISTFQFQDLPIAFYNIKNIQLKGESDTEATIITCNVSKLNQEGKNNLDTDSAGGMGNRFMCKVPKAGKHESTLGLTVDNKSIFLEKFWGSVVGPRQEKPGEWLEWFFDIILDGEKIEVYLPKCMIKEYSDPIKGADPITNELSIPTYSATVTDSSSKFKDLRSNIFFRKSTV